MTLPDNDRCKRVIKELTGEPMLSSWEHDFISSNINRSEFSTAQKEVIARLMDKYEC